MPALVLDANLLTLWVVGSHDPRYIRKFKRTRQFNISDFDRLMEILDQFEASITVPNILTEVSNLLGNAHQNLRYGFYHLLQVWAEYAEEEYVPSRDLVPDPCFSEFGLTDLAIDRILAETEATLVSSDGRLCALLQSRGRDVVWFEYSGE